MHIQEIMMESKKQINQFIEKGGSQMFYHRFKDLTRREKDVLGYVIQGFTAKKIAQALKISPRTVETYIFALRTKFNCNRKGEILLSIIKNSQLSLKDILDNNR